MYRQEVGEMMKMMGVLELGVFEVEEGEINNVGGADGEGLFGGWE